MSQALAGSRKRGRDNCEEERCAFMPLSKRINSIHLTGSNSNGIGHPITLLEQEDCFNHSYGQSSNCIHDAQAYSNDSAGAPDFNVYGGRFGENCTSSVVLQSQEWVAEQIPEQNGYSYNPELNASDNPYYYESNKLLFDLYIERLQRSGLPLQY